MSTSNEPDKSDCSTWVLIRHPSHAPSILDRQAVSLVVGQLMSFDMMTLAKPNPRFYRVNESARPKLDTAVDDSSGPQPILSR